MTTGVWTHSGESLGRPLPAFFKTLLVLEVVVRFGPMTLRLTMGVLLLPIQIVCS